MEPKRNPSAKLPRLTREQRRLMRKLGCRPKQAMHLDRLLTEYSSDVKTLH